MFYPSQRLSVLVILLTVELIRLQPSPTARRKRSMASRTGMLSTKALAVMGKELCHFPKPKRKEK